MTAFGFDILSIYGAGESHEFGYDETGFGFSGGSFGETDGTTVLPRFVGVVSTTPFLGEVGIFAQTHMIIDNLAIQPVPEPASLWLLALAVAGLAGWQWRRRTRSSSPSRILHG